MCWYKSRGLADKFFYSNDLDGDSNGFDIFRFALSLLSKSSSIGFALAAYGAY